MGKLKTFCLAAAAVAGAVLAMAGAASATVLSIGGVAQNKSVTIEATLKSGTSAILKDKNGTTNDTCTGSVVKGSTEGSFEGSTVGGKVSALTFSGCSHTTDVINNGSLWIAWTSGTNGTV